MWIKKIPLLWLSVILLFYFLLWVNQPSVEKKEGRDWQVTVEVYVALSNNERSWFYYKDSSDIDEIDRVNATQNNIHMVEHAWWRGNKNLNCKDFEMKKWRSLISKMTKPSWTFAARKAWSWPAHSALVSFLLLRPMKTHETDDTGTQPKHCMKKNLSLHALWLWFHYGIF